MSFSPLKSGRLGQTIRRLYPIYGYYRRLCALADEMSESERAAHQSRELERISRLAAASGIATGFVLTKEQVRDRPQAFLRHTLWPVSRDATGGTTGLPIIVERSLNAVIFEQATLDHIAALQGIDLARERTAVIRGASIKHPDDLDPPYSVSDNPRRRVFSGFHLSDMTAQAYLSELVKFRPDVLNCYPSTLSILLRLARETRAVLRPKLVMTSSKLLRRELFAEVAAEFGCPLVDYYGQAERLCFAWASEAGSYRFRPEYGQAIITNPGLRGVVCGTGFFNRRQIIVNYNIGDLLIGADRLTDKELQAVALGVKPFAGILGRQNDTMTLPDGRQFAAFDEIAYYVEGADYVQILRRGKAEIEVVVVKNRHYSEATLAQIEKNIRARLPSTLKITYRFSEAPVRTPTGKTPHYIDMLASPNPLRPAGDR
ncbi:MAG: hypothetical protein ACT4SY_15490 [Hyphomicrobiales bacterium]